MPGQLKVGGNVIAEHTGIEGAGEVSLQNVSLGGGQLGGMRNLIINGNFQVNQRGAASITATTSDYNYDRWYYDGTYLYQGVEDKNVFNGTYTLSWQDAGSDITASYVVSTDTTAGDGPDSGQTWTSVSNGGTITVNEGTEYSKHLWVRFGGTLTNLSKVQLEMGSTATPFEHRPYGVELALCQRYYQKYPIGAYTKSNIVVGYNSTTAYGPFQFSPMRTSPTGTVTSGQFLRGTSWVSGTVTMNYITKEGQSSLNLTGSSITASYSYNWKGVVSLDAEL